MGGARTTARTAELIDAAGACAILGVDRAELRRLDQEMLVVGLHERGERVYSLHSLAEFERRRREARELTRAEWWRAHRRRVDIAGTWAALVARGRKAHR